MNASQITVIGHRGAAGFAPENTLASLREAFEKGIKYVEIDIQRSKDGVLLLMHDRYVNRTTNGNGKVADMDWSVLQTLDAGSKFSPKYRGEKIPSLEDALQLVRQANGVLVIEVKYPSHYSNLAKELDVFIRTKNASQYVIVMSFNIRFISELAHLKPDYPLGCLYIYPPRPKASELSFVTFVSVNWRSIYFFSKRLQNLQNQGIITWVWTVNSKKRADSIVHKGIQGIVTDFP